MFLTVASLGHKLLAFDTDLWPGSEVVKLLSCSTQLSIELFLLINDKIPKEYLHFNIHKHDKYNI